MSLRAVIFDVGNTLLCEHENWQEIERKGVTRLVETLRSLGVELEENSFADIILNIRQTNFDRARKSEKEITAYESLQEALKAADVKEVTTEILHRGVEAYYHPLEEISTITPGAAEILRRLSYEGYKLGITSNASYSLSVRRMLEQHGVLHWFQAVLISADVEVRKPDAKIFRMTLEALDVEPEDAIYIGDLPEIDVAGAQSVGIRSILLNKNGQDPVSRERFPADWIASDFDEVARIIRKIANTIF